MDNAEEQLRRELKQLIILLRKVKERNGEMSFLSENEHMMLKNLDFAIKNFENMELRLPPELTGEMAESFGMMIHELIDALQEELGEDGVYLSSEEMLEFNDISDMPKIDKSLEVPTVEELIKNSSEPEIPMKHRIMMAIQQVDERLKNAANFDVDLADDLLDRRSELLEQLRQYS